MLRWGCIFIAAVIAPAASAGPWVRQDDDFYSRLALSRSSIEGLHASRMDAYGEYGLSEHWTATFKYERLQFDDYDEYDADGWRVTLRRGFSLGQGLVASLEGGPLAGEAIGGAGGCQSEGAEARTGLGQGFQLDDRLNGYWFAEGAVRAHADGCMRKRLELGYGQQIFSEIWIMTQAWFDDGDENMSSSKYQLEYMWRTGTFDVSLGSVTELSGNFEETSIFLALARKF